MHEALVSEIFLAGVVGREPRKISPATIRAMREAARIRELIDRAEAIKARGDGPSTAKLILEAKQNHG